MRIAFIGSQQYDNLALVLKAVSLLAEDDLVVSGGAPGVDKTAENGATQYQLARLIIPAQWTRKGKAAGILRNPKIIQSAHIVLAFWDGKSPGTRNGIGHALDTQRPLRIISSHALEPPLDTHWIDSSDPYALAYIAAFIDAERSNYPPR